MENNQQLADEFTAVQQLNPIATARFDETAQLRAEARLEQILTTSPHQIIGQVGLPRRRTRTTWGWAAIPVAAITVLAIVLNQPTQTAFADWTPMPQELTTSDIAAIGETCGNVYWADISPDDPNPMQPMPNNPTVTDRRGNWALALFASPANEKNPWGQSVLCLARNFNNAWNMEMAVARWGGDTFRFGGEAAGVASTPPELITPLGSHEVEFYQAGHIVFDGANRQAIADGNQTRGERGFVTMRGDDPEATALGEGIPDGGMFFAAGRVGDDVAALTLHIPTGDIVARVENGWYVAWWPEGSVPNAARRTRGYTVTTIDGTVLPQVAVDWSDDALLGN